jgi:hypothetical protein
MEGGQRLADTLNRNKWKGKRLADTLNRNKWKGEARRAEQRHQVNPPEEPPGTLVGGQRGLSRACVWFLAYSLVETAAWEGRTGEGQGKEDPGMEAASRRRDPLYINKRPTAHVDLRSQPQATNLRCPSRPGALPRAASSTRR